MNTRIGLGAALGLLAAVAPMRPSAAEDVSFSLPVVSLTVASIYVADDLGYWKSAGLNLTFPVIPGIGSTNAVLAGSIDFTISAGPTMIRANARGQKLVALATTLDRVQQEIVLSKSAAAASGITEASPLAQKAQALRGKRMAVDSFNSVVHSYLRYFARKGGVDPDRDITVTNAQGPVMLAGLKSGSIDGFVLSLPWTVIPVADGSAIKLVSSPRGDLPELEPFTYTVVVAKPDTCDKRPIVCEKLVAGLAKAQTYMREHPKESIAILQKHIKGTDPAVFEQAYELMRASTPKTPRTEEAGMVKAQDYMVATGMMTAQEKLASLRDLFTNKYIKE
jgi:ABC-type nitrate/sulfonate/bicarbonate transport system substrate-binding protein